MSCSIGFCVHRSNTCESLKKWFFMFCVSVSPALSTKKHTHGTAKRWNFNFWSRKSSKGDILWDLRTLQHAICCKHFYTGICTTTVIAKEFLTHVLTWGRLHLLWSDRHSHKHHKMESILTPFYSPRGKRKGVGESWTNFYFYPQVGNLVLKVIAECYFCVRGEPTSALVVEKALFTVLQGVLLL